MTLTITTVSAEPAIQQITTKSGLKAWLVESHSIPMISIEIAFRAGSAFEGNKNGLAHLTASLLDEGAGNKNDREFKESLERIGARFGAGADKLDFTVSMDSLSDKIDDSFVLLSDALLRPRFDDEPIQRIKSNTLAALKRQEEDPGAIARRAYNEALYGDHPYAKPVLGTKESIKNLTKEDIQTYFKNNVTRANMVISVVGDITAEQLGKLLEKNLTSLPEGTKRNEITHGPADIQPQVQKIERAVPQSTLLMGHLGVSREDPDYFSTFVMNHILGGGGFSARLMEEIREKRGLTYGVYSSFSPLPYRGSFTVQLATKNDDAKNAIALVEKEMKKLQDHGITDKEYEDAINYLTGSFPLRLDSNEKILGYLSVMQMEDLGADYLSTWTDHIRAVTKEDIQKAAQTHLHPDNLVTVTVGAGAAIE